jgi:hypothetical protein
MDWPDSSNVSSAVKRKSLTKERDSEWGKVWRSERCWDWEGGGKMPLQTNRISSSLRGASPD